MPSISASQDSAAVAEFQLAFVEVFLKLGPPVPGRMPL